MVNIRSALPLGSAKKVDSALSNLRQAPMSLILDCEYKGTTIYCNTEIIYPFILLNGVNK